MAADVYGVAPHTGRGGWTWYTGSAGWMYRLIVESLLGLQLETTKDGPRLHLKPCLPADWTGFSLEYRYRRTRYHIEVTQGDGENGGAGVTIDGHAQPEMVVPLIDDLQAHQVNVVLSSQRQMAPA